MKNSASTRTLVTLALVGSAILLVYLLGLMGLIVLTGGLDMEMVSIASAPLVSTRALGVDVAMLIRKAITRRACDLPTPATDAPLAGPVTVTFDSGGRGFPHPYNGEWADAFDRAHRSARMAGQTCTYETPADMAVKHATTKHRDPTVSNVEISRA